MSDLVLRQCYGHANRLYQSTYFLKKTITSFLIETLPKSYQKEAQSIFYESCEPTNIKEALYYFEGGIQYRLRWVKKQFGCLAFYIDQKTHAAGDILFANLEEQTDELIEGEYLNSVFYSIQMFFLDEGNSLLQSLETGRQRYLHPLFSGRNLLSLEKGSDSENIKQE